MTGSIGSVLWRLGRPTSPGEPAARLEPGFVARLLHGDAPARPGKDDNEAGEVQRERRHVEKEGYTEHGRGLNLGLSATRGPASILLLISTGGLHAPDAHRVRIHHRACRRRCRGHAARLSV